MLTIEYIAAQLKKEYPPYNFPVYQGLFKKYIIVEIHGRGDFSIWIDKNTGHKELFDELYFNKRNWFKRRFKTSLFHFSRPQINLSKNYIGKAQDKERLRLPERKLIKKRLQESLDRIHIF